jgi:type IV pilus assembly protein PilV
MPLNRSQTGFTLLEVMVAIVVLSLGLLGLAGLQAATLRNNQIAYYRAIAVQQTYDMADRIRANQAGATAGEYNALAAIIPAAPDCVAPNTCSPADMAVADHSQWNNNNARMLPGGSGTVTNAAGNNFIITVMMTENEMSGASDPNCPVGTPANVRCFLTRVSL